MTVLELHEFLSKLIVQGKGSYKIVDLDDLVLKEANVEEGVILQRLDPVSGMPYETFVHNDDLKAKEFVPQSVKEYRRGQAKIVCNAIKF